MTLCDVNVFIAAFHAGHPHHDGARKWFEKQISSAEPFGVSDVALTSYLRIITAGFAVRPAVRIDDALDVIERLLDEPNCVLLTAGPKHFEIFRSLCRGVGAKGTLVSDAYFAALAIEHGCRWYSFDRDFARFPGLDWAVPAI